MTQVTIRDLPSAFADGRIDLDKERTFWVATFSIEEGKTGLVVLKKDDQGSYVMASDREVAEIVDDPVATILLQDLLSLDVTDAAMLYSKPMEMLRKYLPMSELQMQHWIDQGSGEE